MVVDATGRRARRRAGAPASAPGAGRLSALQEALRRAASDLTTCGARFALVGGLAVSARAEPRFTRDVDLIEEVRALLRRVEQGGFHRDKRLLDELEALLRD